MAAQMSYALLVIDREYVARELLPSLATRYFGHAAGAEEAGARLDFKVAVLSRTAPNAFVFQSPPSFTPTLDAQADATADLFQVRTQDFLSLAAEVRRFTAFVAPHGSSVAGTARVAVTEMTETRPMSILITPGRGTGSAADGPDKKRRPGPRRA